MNLFNALALAFLHGLHVCGSISTLSVPLQRANVSALCRLLYKIFSSLALTEMRKTGVKPEDDYIHIVLRSVRPTGPVQLPVLQRVQHADPT